MNQSIRLNNFAIYTRTHRFDVFDTFKSEHELIKFTPIANQISIVRACSDFNQIKESLPVLYVPYILI